MKLGNRVTGAYKVDVIMRVLVLYSKRIWEWSEELPYKYPGSQAHIDTRCKRSARLSV